MNIEYGLLNDTTFATYSKLTCRLHWPEKKTFKCICFVDFDEIDEFQHKKFNAFRKK